MQSHVKAHSELCWLLNTQTPMSWCERMIQYKEKAVKQGDNVGVGLFDYPVLMAADILLYQARRGWAGGGLGGGGSVALAYPDSCFRSFARAWFLSWWRCGA